MSRFRSPGHSRNVVHRIQLPELDRVRFQRRLRRLGVRSDGFGDEPPHVADEGPPANGSALRGGAPTAGPGARESKANGLRAPGTESPAENGRGAEVTPGSEPVIPRFSTVPLVAPEQTEDLEARRQIQFLERRLAKMARLLEKQESEMQARREVAPDSGLASVYGEVQGLQEDDSEIERKRSLMARIFESNLKLRERVTSVRRAAE